MKRGIDSVSGGVPSSATKKSGSEEKDAGNEVSMMILYALILVLTPRARIQQQKTIQFQLSY